MIFNFVDKETAYDGAAVMASSLNGLQEEVKAVGLIPHILEMSFCRLGCMYFSKSMKGFMFLKESECTRLPRNAPTCQNFSSRIVRTAAKKFEKLFDAFQRLLESENVDEEQLDSSIFWRMLNSFSCR